MKILFFIESLHSGGKERRLVELIKGLKQYPEIECELVLTRKDIHYKDIFSTGIKIHFIVRKYLKKDPRSFFMFFRICKKYKPDIIHVWGSMVAIYAIPAKVLLKIPLINSSITYATPIKIFSKIWLTLILTIPFSNFIVSNSKAGLKTHKLKNNQKNRVIYNGFNFDRIKNISDQIKIRNKFNIVTKYVIGMVASFSNYKDYETYIKAAHEVLQNNNSVTFLCIGAGDDSYFQSSVKPEFKENIKFLGRQGNVESIMNICDIGVLMSNPNTHGEGISNALMEFMALSKPIIASDGGGTGELIIDEETGFLVKPESVEELASKIVYLLENEAVALKMGVKGRERIKQEFDLGKMVIIYYNLYQKLILSNKNKEEKLKL